MQHTMTEKLGYCRSLKTAGSPSNILVTGWSRRIMRRISCSYLYMRKGATAYYVEALADFSYDFGVCLDPGLLAVAAGILTGGWGDLGLGRAGGWHSISSASASKFTYSSNYNLIICDFIAFSLHIGRHIVTDSHIWRICKALFGKRTRRRLLCEAGVYY
jgi:hypothetical protein